MDGAKVGARLRAAQVTAPGQVAMVEAPLVAPGPGAVRVALEGCGVCASNLGPWSGPPWMSFPLVPGDLGHEAWGHVDAVGEGVAPERLGQRVAIMGFHGYASHDSVPADAALPIPDALRDEAVPAEPLACALSILRRMQIRAGDSVAIVGTGFLGLMLCQLAAGQGARVIAMARREDALALARRMGAAETVRLEDHDSAVARVRDMTGGQGADIAVECAGHQWPLDLASQVVREGGRLVIAGYHQDGPRQVDMLGWNWRALDIVNAHERRREVILQDMRDAIAALAEGRLTPGPLLTHVYPLSRLAEALDATRDKPAGFVKALVVPA